MFVVLFLRQLGSRGISKFCFVCEWPEPRFFCGARLVPWPEPGDFPQKNSGLMAGGSWELLCKVTDEELKKTKIPILFAAVTGSGEAILTGSSRPRLQVWRLGEGEVTHAGTLKANAAPSCIECGDQNHVAVATQNGQIFLYDLREPQRPSLSLPSTMAEATAVPRVWLLLCARAKLGSQVVSLGALRDVIHIHKKG